MRLDNFSARRIHLKQNYLNIFTFSNWMVHSLVHNSTRSLQKSSREHIKSKLISPASSHLVSVTINFSCKQQAITFLQIFLNRNVTVCANYLQQYFCMSHPRYLVSMAATERERTTGNSATSARTTALWHSLLAIVVASKDNFVHMPFYAVRRGRNPGVYKTW